jgi:hypothetical protein
MLDGFDVAEVTGGPVELASEGFAAGHQTSMLSRRDQSMSWDHNENMNP